MEGHEMLKTKVHDSMSKYLITFSAFIYHHTGYAGVLTLRLLF